MMTGFENLTIKTIWNRSNLLRDIKFSNNHYDTGVLLRNQTKNELLYLLEKIDIKNDNDRYNNLLSRPSDYVDVTNEHD